MSRRAEFRNEVKTRLKDRSYDALQAFKQVHGIDSDSAAVARIVDLGLFGMYGTLPMPLVDVSDRPGHIGTLVAA